MGNQQNTPPMSSHKAIAAAIASLVCTIVLALLGITPTTEAMLSADLQSLLENLAALLIMTIVPGVVAYYKRNHLK